MIASRKGLRMLSFFMDNVIFLRALCRASYRKSNKYIIYNLAYPRLRDGLCRYSLRMAVVFPVVAYFSEGEKRRPEIRLRFAG